MMDDHSTIKERKWITPVTSHTTTTYLHPFSFEVRLHWSWKKNRNILFLYSQICHKRDRSRIKEKVFIYNLQYYVTVLPDYHIYNYFLYIFTFIYLLDNFYIYTFFKYSSKNFITRIIICFKNINFLYLKNITEFRKVESINNKNY